MDNESLFEKRMAICRACPLFTVNEVFGPECNSKKWISPDGETASIFKKEGWTRGCGCKLNWKCKNEKSRCIIGKW